MLRSFTLILLAFGAIAASAFAQGLTIEFSPEQIYIIPGVDKIDEALFNDIDYDGLPEILVRRANHIQVYSKAEEAILFQTDIDTARWRGIVFADINRDSVVDIAVACFHDCRDHSDSALSIDIYNGAAGNAVTRYYYPNAERTFGPWLIYSSGFSAFKALDVNHDGYDELFISHCNWIWDGGAGPSAHIWYERQFATSKIFHSFPGSIMWQGARQLADPVIVIGENGPFLMANNFLKYSEGSITDSYYQRNSVIRFEADYSGIYTISDSVLRNTSDKNDCIRFTSTQSLLMKCAGDLIGSNGGREFLASFYFLWDCYEYGELGPQPDSSGSEMRMYRMASPD
jgi:hypothetical protein